MSTERPSSVHPEPMLLPLALSLCALAAASPLVQKYRPLVLWHGLGRSDLSVSIYQTIAERRLGDSHSSPGMLEFASLIGEMYPGIFIHSIYIEEDADADRKATFVRAYRPIGLLRI